MVEYNTTRQCLNGIKIAPLDLEVFCSIVKCGLFAKKSLVPHVFQKIHTPSILSVECQIYGIIVIRCPPYIRTFFVLKTQGRDSMYEVCFFRLRKKLAQTLLIPATEIIKTMYQRYHFVGISPEILLKY